MLFKPVALQLHPLARRLDQEMPHLRGFFSTSIRFRGSFSPARPNSVAHLSAAVARSVEELPPEISLFSFVEF